MARSKCQNEFGACLAVWRAVMHVRNTRNWADHPRHKSFSKPFADGIFCTFDGLYTVGLNLEDDKREKLVRDWLDWRGDAITPLFCQIYQGKAVDRILSDTTVKRLIKSAAKSAGLDAVDIADFSGHSMRVGAAQDLLKAGHGTAVIMRAGGLKSLDC